MIGLTVRAHKSYYQYVFYPTILRVRLDSREISEMIAVCRRGKRPNSAMNTPRNQKLEILRMIKQGRNEGFCVSARSINNVQGLPNDFNHGP